MKKVIVIGCPGSGKSTFSKKLHHITGLPLFHLDMMYWNADRTIVEKTVFREQLANTLKKDAWIIDGNYSSTMELRLLACDTVFFLDYPPEVCLEGIQERKGTPRTDMPWIEDKNEEDTAFLEFIKSYPIESRPKVIALLNQYSHKTIYIFKTRSEATDYLNLQAISSNS